jgi:hypothetical protein
LLQESLLDDHLIVQRNLYLEDEMFCDVLGLVKNLDTDGVTLSRQLNVTGWMGLDPTGRNHEKNHQNHFEFHVNTFSGLYFCRVIDSTTRGPRSYKVIVLFRKVNIENKSQHPLPMIQHSLDFSIKEAQLQIKREFITELVLGQHFTHKRTIFYDHKFMLFSPSPFQQKTHQ